MASILRLFPTFPGIPGDKRVLVACAFAAAAFLQGGDAVPQPILVAMGYANEPSGPHDAADSLIDHGTLRRHQRRELLPLEARRLLWEGALLVQDGPEDGMIWSWPGVVVLPPELESAGIRERLSDPTLPLVCVPAAELHRSTTPRAPDALVERLRALGYGQVFSFALSSLEALEAGR